MKRLIAVGLLMFTFMAAGARADDIPGLIKAVDSKKGDCAVLAFADTRKYVDLTLRMRALGRDDLADDSMEKAYDAYERNDTRYLEMLMTSDILRERLTKIKTTAAGKDGVAKKNTEPKIRAADIKLNFCDLFGAETLIIDLEKNIK